jgi:hypothetical protein
MTRSRYWALPWASAPCEMQGLGVHEALPDAPVAVQQVAEVQDVGPELEGVPCAAEVLEEVLGDGEVDPIHHREDDTAPLRVLAAAG